MTSPCLSLPGAVSAADVDPPAPTRPAAAVSGSGAPAQAGRAALATPTVPPVTDAGVAAHYGDPLREQRALVAGHALVDLSHRDVLTVTGPDRLPWLHSLTTQHVSELSPLDSAEALVLSPHGHVEHALHIVETADGTWITVEPGTGEALAAWLTSMVFMRDVQVRLVNEDFAVLGYHADDDRTIDAPGVVWRDPWPGPVGDTTVYGCQEGHPGKQWRWHEIIVPRFTLASLAAGEWPQEWHHLLPAGVERPTWAGTWAMDALRIAAYRPRLGFESDHRTIPHEADWLRTAVHLHKGCYRGQETVARVHNLGKPPRRLTMLHLDGSEHELPGRGAEVAREGAPRSPGQITSRAWHYELGPIALALLKRSTPADVPLAVGAVAATQDVVVQP